jgi:hypothetical protein
MTVQPSHSITLKLFAAFVHEMIRLEKLEKDADIKLVVVVPPDAFDDYKRCVCELTTYWQSPCLVVRCSEQKHILDGNKEYNSATAGKVLLTEQKKFATTEKNTTEELATTDKIMETEKLAETKKTAKQDEAKRCAIQHALDATNQTVRDGAETIIAVLCGCTSCSSTSKENLSLLTCTRNIILRLAAHINTDVTDLTLIGVISEHTNEK